MYVDTCSLSGCDSVFVFLIDVCIQQLWRRLLDFYALNVVLQRNPAKLVVVVAAVLGLGTAEVLAIRNLITRGTRAYRPAKHGRSPT